MSALSPALMEITVLAGSTESEKNKCEKCYEGHLRSIMFPSRVTVPDLVWVSSEGLHKDTLCFQAEIKVKAGWMKTLKCEVGRPREQHMHTL